MRLFRCKKNALLYGEPGYGKFKPQFQVVPTTVNVPILHVDIQIVLKNGEKRVFRVSAKDSVYTFPLENYSLMNGRALSYADLESARQRGEPVGIATQLNRAPVCFAPKVPNFNPNEAFGYTDDAGFVHQLNPDQIAEVVYSAPFADTETLEVTYDKLVPLTPQGE